MDRVRLLGYLAAIVIVIGPTLPLSAAPGDRPRPPRPGGDIDVAEDEPIDGVFVPPDRSARRRLDLAREMLADGRHGEAVRFLGSLLEAPEDYFIRPSGSEPLYRSLKAEAGRLIATMSQAARESYELEFGARARRLLDEAVASGSIDNVAEVSRRFFYTNAGFEATVLVAQHHLDHNRPLAAALCFERLLETAAARERLEPMLSLELATCWQRAGSTKKAQDVLVNLKRFLPRNELLIAGRPVKLFADDTQALAWFTANVGAQKTVASPQSDQWVMFRGDPSRNATSVGGRPLLNVRWRQRTADDRAIENLVAPLRRAYLDQQVPILPSMSPLAIGNVVVMRTMTNMQAVDFTTGKLVWRYPSSDESLDPMLRTGGSQQASGVANYVLRGIEQRLWDDAIYGTLSSDGERVFYVEELGLLPLMFGTRTVFLANGQLAASAGWPQSTNRLAARDLRTEGKLKWHVGGASGEDEPQLAGAFFLGPGLPLQNRVYAIAEMKGQEIRLVALSAETGRLEWSQQLAVVEQNLSQDPFAIRRTAGANPSFADGVLICPTSSGAMVAVDLTNRSLLWGYQYPRIMQPSADRVGALLAGYPTEQRTNDRWCDGTPMIIDRRVLVTPVESDQIYCLNLADGELLWKHDRGENIYVGCANDGKVLLVGRSQVTALKLSDGTPAWGQTIALPNGVLPSGRGFYNGQAYFLPLTSGEVVAIDVAKGSIEGRAKSRGGDVPGNLICFQDSVISQNIDNLDAFFQLDALKASVAKRLKEQPNDPKALSQLGELELDAGNLQKAISLFRKSYESQSDESTRALLVSSLIEGLKTDFTEVRSIAEEFEPLFDDKPQRTTYLRLMAVGLQRAGETLPALKNYLKLVDDDVDPQQLEELDDSQAVCRDRWVQVELANLRERARPDERKVIDEAVATRLTEAQKQDPDALRRFIAIFGSHSLADVVRETLASRLSGYSTLLEREQLLHRLQQSKDENRLRIATVGLASLYLEANCPKFSAIYYRQLGAKWRNVVCLDGKTGQQLLDELPSDSPVRELLRDESPWPQGNIVVPDKLAPAKTPVNTRLQPLVEVELRGPAGPFFGDARMFVDQQQQQFVVQDGLGRKQLSMSLTDRNPRRLKQNVYVAFNQQTYNAGVNGNLVVLSMGQQIMAIDCLRPGDPLGQRILWTQELGETFPGVQVNQGFNVRRIAVAWGGTRTGTNDVYGRPVGTMGPVGFDQLCFQRLRDLVCVEPRTGRAIWTRHNVPPGCELFGDDELLFAAPSDGSDALVFRAADGQLLGKRPMRPSEQRMATIGRFVLTWQAIGRKQVLSLIDPWEEQVVWSKSFVTGTSGSARAALVGQHAVGVLEPDGHFLLLSLPDGKALIEDRLLAERNLDSIYLLRSADQYLLITNAPAPRTQRVTYSAPPGAVGQLVSGHVYAFDRETGRKLWPEPAIVHQHGLYLNQPSDLPVLVFARRVDRSSPRGEAKTSILCIDKRSGRTVYQTNDLSGIVANMELIGDRRTNTVSLMLPIGTLTMKLTNDPIPPPESKETKPESKGVWKAMRKAVGRAVHGLDDLEIAPYPGGEDE